MTLTRRCSTGLRCHGSRTSGLSGASLTAVPPLTARPALTRPRIDVDGFGHLPACRPDLFGHVEHPRPQLAGVVDSVPGPVPRHDEPVRRPDAGLLLDE